MQLTPLQLEIQQRADRTLSFWCIIQTKEWIARIYKVDGSDPARTLYYIDQKPNVVKRATWLKVIWHRMNRWRLFYLLINPKSISQESQDSFDKIVSFLSREPKRYQYTVLERPIELQKLVLKFLLTLPKCN